MSVDYPACLVCCVEAIVGKGGLPLIFHAERYETALKDFSNSLRSKILLPSAVILVILDVHSSLPNSVITPHLQDRPFCQVLLHPPNDPTSNVAH